MKTIPVKIGWEILLIVYGAFCLIVYQTFSEPKLTGIAVAALYFIFVTVSIFGVKYKTDYKILEITNGFFGKTKIDIDKIRTIEKTSNAISSPAPSIIGRVEIYYGNKSVVISPKYFNEFRDDLLAVNPDILVKE